MEVYYILHIYIFRVSLWAILYNLKINEKTKKKRQLWMHYPKKTAQCKFHYNWWNDCLSIQFELSIVIFYVSFIHILTISFECHYSFFNKQIMKIKTNNIVKDFWIWIFRKDWKKHFIFLNNKFRNGNVYLIYLMSCNEWFRWTFEVHIYEQTNSWILECELTSLETNFILAEGRILHN